MQPLKVLFMGESYTAMHTYLRGANYVSLPEYSNTGVAFADMLRAQGIEVEHLPTHEVPGRCPISAKDFAAYDVVILSDVASDTMLTQPAPAAGQLRLNRLDELRRYVQAGGGLLMCGGYFSFSGVGNTARYGMTPLAQALPVDILNYDDRIECPQGVVPELTPAGADLLQALPGGVWPDFNGYNKTICKLGAVEFARFGTDPFLVGMEYGSGRSFAFTSDCEPNWATHDFLKWPGYPALFSTILQWIARR